MFKNLFKGLNFFIKLSIEIDKKYLIFHFLSAINTSLMALSAVVLPKYLIDEFMGSARLGVLFGLATALIIIECAGKALGTWFVKKYFVARLHIANEYSIRMHIDMAQADYDRMESKDYHELMERAQKFMYCDWHGFGYVVDSAFDIVAQAFTLVGLGAILALINPWLLICYAALAGLDAWVSARAKRKAIVLELKAVDNERALQYYSDLFTNPRFGKEIRTFSLYDWLAGKERACCQRSTDTYAQRNSYYVRSSTINSLTGILRGGIGYTYLILRVTSGALGIGDFTMYASAMSSFAGALTGLLSATVDIKQYGAYYDAMEEFLAVPKAIRNGGHDPVPAGALRFQFENVTYCYPGQQNDALKNITLTLEPGEKLAIVGENGAGKSTFIKLLMRIYAPTSGRITLNDTDISTIDYDEYVKLFAPVFQDFNLYAFSLKDNVTFGEDADISPLIARTGMKCRIDSLSNGENTPVMKTFDAAGFEPSGGEAQKIALMRALYKNSPIIVLDEPNAALDPRAEYELYSEFDKLISGKTAVYISHRLSSARFCDKICVLRNGEILEQGNHAELMAAHGLYAELFGMQRQYYI